MKFLSLSKNNNKLVWKIRNKFIFVYIIQFCIGLLNVDVYNVCIFSDDIDLLSLFLHDPSYITH